MRKVFSSVVIDEGSPSLLVDLLHKERAKLSAIEKRRHFFAYLSNSLQLTAGELIGSQTGQSFGEPATRSPMKLRSLYTTGKGDAMSEQGGPKSVSTVDNKETKRETVSVYIPKSHTKDDKKEARTS